MDRWLKPISLGLGAVIVLVFLILLVLPLLWVNRVTDEVFQARQIWQIYSSYVDAAAKLTGLNQYLVTALALALFIPFYHGVRMVTSSFSVSILPGWAGGEGLTRKQKLRKRYIGAAILACLAVGYNLSLYYLTQEMAFAFSSGAPQKWYARTPEGVKFYDRPGVDPAYGIPLQPVTPEIIRSLKLQQQGEFKPIDPSRATFFNPITGQAQVWYYRAPDGMLEFYDKPGHHPGTGTPLQAITEQVVFEWQRMRKVKMPATSGSATTGPGGAVTGGGSQGTGSQPATSVVEVRSDPQGAEAYVDWKARGETPLPIEAKQISGLVVVVKDGFQAAFRRVNSHIDGPIEFALTPERAHPRTRLLLLPSVGASSEVVSSLRGRLVEEGFTVLGTEEAKEFQREMERAGGLSNRALRAWARARFDTDLLLVTRIRHSGRQVSDQEMGSSEIRDAVKGVVRTEVGIDAEVVDLRSGDHIAAVSTTGAAFALDRAQSLQKATTQAVTESAKRIRQRIQG